MEIFTQRMSLQTIKQYSYIQLFHWNFEAKKSMKIVPYVFLITTTDDNPYTKTIWNLIGNVQNVQLFHSNVEDKHVS